MINFNFKFIFVLFLLFSFANIIVESIKCYSCASENLQQDFLTRQRRPPGNMISLPKIFDNNCDLDTWILRTKSEVDCPGSCYKWQQTLNNSGVYSYMTVRSCYEHMFGSSPSTQHETECSEKSNSLACLPESSIFEHECFCKNADHFFLNV
uniref:Uncharacterized protein n=1 Tax=Panagrolaimus superbus TaxID=310955 RepID=A0A914XVR5_9BILA